MYILNGHNIFASSAGYSGRRCPNTVSGSGGGRTALWRLQGPLPGPSVLFARRQLCLRTNPAFAQSDRTFIPGSIPPLGLLYHHWHLFDIQKNGSANGVYEVEDGSTENAESLGRILSWNDASTLPEYWWEGVQARMINGNFQKESFQFLLFFFYLISIHFRNRWESIAAVHQQGRTAAGVCRRYVPVVGFRFPKRGGTRRYPRVAICGAEGELGWVFGIGQWSEIQNKHRQGTFKTRPWSGTRDSATPGTQNCSSPSKNQHIVSRPDCWMSPVVKQVGRSKKFHEK